MSIDGAFQGLDAETAMHAAIGGVADRPARTKEQVREIVTSAEWDQALEGGAGYEMASNVAARLILEAIERSPEIDWQSIPTERTYGYLDADGKRLPRGDYGGTFTKLTDGWDDYLHGVWTPEDHETWEALGLTGFQWGWAVNTVRWLLDMPPVGNPAILTIGGSDD